jgi:transmembrane sensor
LWRELDHVDSTHRIDIESLLTEAQENVVELRDGQQGPSSENRITNWRRRLAGLAASLAVAVGSTFWLLQNNAASYATDVGQQLSFTVSDGSNIHLNTQSALDVVITQEKREFTLLSGEAMFEVAKDPNRPFRVRAGSAIVEAIGTEFNVYRRQTSTTVTVIQGKVSVASADRSSEALQEAGNTAIDVSIVLSDGEEAQVYKSGEVTRIEKTDLEKNVAWRNRRLVFRADSLADVASEFNRYNQQKIFIEFPDSSARQITGTFDATDPESFIEFLSRNPAIDVVRDGDRIVITQKTY